MGALKGRPYRNGVGKRIEAAPSLGKNAGKMPALP